jgi:hypothetical protein
MPTVSAKQAILLEAEVQAAAAQAASTDVTRASWAAPTTEEALVLRKFVKTTVIPAQAAQA